MEEDGAESVTPLEALIDAARYGDLDDLKEAMEAGAPVNGKDEDGRTANGHKEIVQALLSSNAEANAKNEQGNTPLHWAAVNGRAEVVELLLRGGADPTILNSHERTPVDEALHSGHNEIIDLINRIYRADRPAEPPADLDTAD